MHKFAILTALLIFSFGFTSAYADETFVNPDNLSFGQFSESIPQHVPTIIDPLTGEEPVIDLSKQYTAYSVELGSNIDSNEKQLVSIDAMANANATPDSFAYFSGIGSASDNL